MKEPSSALSRGLVVLLPAVFGVACASQQLKLDMERQVVIVPPVIESLTTEPTGRLDTRGQDHTVKVVMRGDPGLAGTCEATLGSERQTIAMREATPGTYEGSFSVPAGREGPVSLVGHLRHEPTGAQQEIREGGVLDLWQSPPPEGAQGTQTGGCSQDVAARLEAQLRSVTIRFDFNHAELRADATQNLRAAGAFLAGETQCTVLVEGHADEVGSPEYNQELSEKRASVVRAFLQSELGVPGGRLQARGFGETRPLDTAKTPAAYEHNRRVELHVAGAS